jgi:hypothetical protein
MVHNAAPALLTAECGGRASPCGVAMYVLLEELFTRQTMFLKVKKDAEIIHVVLEDARVSEEPTPVVKLSP